MRTLCRVLIFLVCLHPAIAEQPQTPLRRKAQQIFSRAESGPTFSFSPSGAPSHSPEPSISEAPSSEPTDSPTESPTGFPTFSTESFVKTCEKVASNYADNTCDCSEEDRSIICELPGSQNFPFQYVVFEYDEKTGKVIKGSECYCKDENNCGSNPDDYCLSMTLIDSQNCAITFLLDGAICSNACKPCVDDMDAYGLDIDACFTGGTPNGCIGMDIAAQIGENHDRSLAPPEFSKACDDIISTYPDSECKCFVADLRMECSLENTTTDFQNVYLAFLYDSNTTKVTEGFQCFCESSLCGESAVDYCISTSLVDEPTCNVTLLQTNEQYTECCDVCNSDNYYGVNTNECYAEDQAVGCFEIGIDKASGENHALGTSAAPSSSLAPSSAPSISSRPSTSPSSKPSQQLSVAPSISSSPTTAPTPQPTTAPIGTSVFLPLPTNRPSSSPSAAPSSDPAAVPSSAPSTEPSHSPSTVPTASFAPPTPVSEAVFDVSPSPPTGQPTQSPTIAPVAKPTGPPTQQPTGTPTTAFVVLGPDPTISPSIETTSNPLPVTAKPTGPPPTQQPTVATQSTTIDASGDTYIYKSGFLPIEPAGREVTMLVQNGPADRSDVLDAYSLVSFELGPDSPLSILTTARIATPSMDGFGANLCLEHVQNNSPDAIASILTICRIDLSQSQDTDLDVDRADSSSLLFSMPKDCVGGETMMLDFEVAPADKEVCIDVLQVLLSPTETSSENTRHLEPEGTLKSQGTVLFMIDNIYTEKPEGDLFYTSDSGARSPKINIKHPVLAPSAPPTLRPTVAKIEIETPQPTPGVTLLSGGSNAQNSSSESNKNNNALFSLFLLLLLIPIAWVVLRRRRNIRRQYEGNTTMFQEEESQLTDYGDREIGAFDEEETATGLEPFGGHPGMYFSDRFSEKDDENDGSVQYSSAYDSSAESSDATGSCPW